MTRTRLTDEEAHEAAIRAVEHREQWDTCVHASAEPDHHSCPSCGGTLRRCCDTLVGMYEHKLDCPEVARRRGEGVA